MVTGQEDRRASGGGGGDFPAAVPLKGNASPDRRELMWPSATETRRGPIGLGSPPQGRQSAASPSFSLRLPQALQRHRGMPGMHCRKCRAQRRPRGPPDRPIRHGWVGGSCVAGGGVNIRPLAHSPVLGSAHPPAADDPITLLNRPSASSRTSGPTPASWAAVTVILTVTGGGGV